MILSETEAVKFMFFVAQLRHAYIQLTRNAVHNQEQFAKGLIGPVIEFLEPIADRAETVAQTTLISKRKTT